MEIKIWLQHWGGRGQEWVWPLWSQDSKIGCISRINLINWFLLCWYKFRKAKSFFNSFWVVFKNVNGLLRLGALKYKIYLKNELMKWADFFNVDTNLGKLKVSLIVIGRAWPKTGEALQIMGLLNQFYHKNDFIN